MLKKDLMELYGTRVEPKTGGNSKLMPIHLPEDLNDVYVYSVNKDLQAKERLVCTPIDEERKKLLKKECWWYSGNTELPRDTMRKELLDLRSRLLAFAGEEACLPADEEDLDDILEYGQFWFGHGAKMMLGRPSKCHSNVCELWENNKDKMRICTGYALSEDGMWRQHSWGIIKTPRSIKIVETTKKRVAYYGFVMTDEQAEEFAYYNSPF